MRRYRKNRMRDQEELEARLNALRPSSTSRRRRKRRSNAGPTILGVLAIVALLGLAYLMFTSFLGGEEQAAGKPVTVTVVEGDSLSSVSEKLKGAGVISNATLFELQARMGGKSTEIKPGKYRFRPGEDGDSILAKLTEGKEAATYTVTVPEGLTLRQTAETVAEASGGDISAAEFEKAASKTDYGYAFLEDPAIKTTEGFLFPKSYEFEKGTTARQVVDRMLNQYLIETEGLDFKSAQNRLNLSEYELITAASLIEREAANDKERPLIASVIYNRMRQGMPLQIDATIQYARGKPKEDLSLQDLEINSPYNTYKNPGLPPGPIASPSLASIKAALEPAETDYLYYVLKADGEEHYFTNNYNDFLQAKAEAGR